MTTGSLRTLRRLRHHACEDARLALVACIAMEDTAQAALKAAERAIRREQEEASRIDASDGAVEAFARWLPRGRQAVSDATGALERAEAATAQARAVLAAARASLKAAETLATERERQSQAEAARREQAALDEAAGRRRETFD